MRTVIPTGPDGRTVVTEAATGREVRLYPVDAREAVRIGSHAWPKGFDPMIASDEVERLSRELAALKAQRAPDVAAQAQSAPAGNRSASPQQAESRKP